MVSASRVAYRLIRVFFSRVMSMDLKIQQGVSHQAWSNFRLKFNEKGNVQEAKRLNWPYINLIADTLSVKNGQL